MPAIDPKIVGLSTSEVDARIQAGQTHTLVGRSNRSYLQIFRENLFSLYNIILLLSAGLVLLLQGTKDVWVAVSLVLANSTISMVQELRAKRTLDGLASLVNPTATVIRQNETYQIPISQIVQDDILEIFPGASVIVDGHLLSGQSLEIDESTLTGESEYIAKKPGDYLTSGSYCVTGSGLMRAEKIGTSSAVYQMSLHAKSFRFPKTPLESWLSKTFQLLILAIFILAPLTLVAGINQSLPLSEALANVVNLVSSLIPQGLIVSITILFTYGVILISRNQVLISRVNSVASMGNITMLCTDKTGTLTTNQSAVKALIPLNQNSLDKLKKSLGIFSRLTSYPNRVIQAVLSSVSQLSISLPAKIREIPFSADRKWSAISIKGQSLVLGAPEILTANPAILAHVSHLSKQGLQVLALADNHKVISADSPKLSSQIELIGLIGIEEGLRPDVISTLAEFTKQKINIKIISGDNAETVSAVARLSGLPYTSVCTQDMLLRAEKNHFSLLIKEFHLFARISPQMKQKIVTDLVRQGEYVAMIGDGVNDVLALKAAHVAIAVNDGTQITKDISDIILLENAFSALPKALSEGKDITQRVYAVMTIFFVKVIYLITLIMLAGFASFAFPISLRQTTWLGFIMVGIPTTMIAFRLLQPKPIDNIRHDVAQYTILAGLIAGLAMSLIMIVLQIFLQEDLETSRTAITVFACLFGSIVLLNTVGIKSLSDAKYKKTSLFIISIIGLIAVSVPLRIAPHLFRYSSLDASEWLILTFSIAVCVVVLRLVVTKLRLVTFIKKLLF